MKTPAELELETTKETSYKKSKQTSEKEKGKDQKEVKKLSKIQSTIFLLAMVAILIFVATL